jgi:hypothetical protein
MRSSSVFLCLALAVLSARPASAADDDDFLEEDIDLGDDFDDEPDVQDRPPPPKPEVTVETAEHILLVIKNVGEVIAQVFWRVPDGPEAGTERYFADIAAGEYKQFYTLPRQTWVVRGESKLIKVITTKPSPQKQEYATDGSGADDDKDGESLEDDDAEIDLEDLEEDTDSGKKKEEL